MTFTYHPKPVVGMIHLLALPGAPRYGDSLDLVAERALLDAKALVEGGCHALMMENFGDTPFHPARIDAAVVACMTSVACEIKRHHSLPLGINILRNDGLSALAVAVAARANFIRVNVLTGARVTDQGIVQGIAYELLRDRKRLGAQNIQILADVDVKHSAALAPRPISDEVQDLIKRGMADAVIVSGSGTGAAVDLNKLAEVKKSAGQSPVLIGSGATKETIASLALHASGFIVGSAFKADGDPTKAVELKKVQEFMASYRRLS